MESKHTQKKSSAFGCLTVLVRKNRVKYEEKPINCWESWSTKGHSTTIISCFCLALWWFCPYQSWVEAGKGWGEGRKVSGLWKGNDWESSALWWLLQTGTGRWAKGKHQEDPVFIWNSYLFFLFSALVTVHPFEYLLLAWDWRSSFYLLYTNPCMNYISLHRN